ncbi:MAG TPA: DUF2269 family protein [Candidatus Limnocylindria bacterium]
MFEVFPWLLFLHVMAAIVAFGPTFAFSIIGAMGGAEPQHASFATRVSHRIGDILVEPFAISMFVTGVLLIWAADIPLLDPNWRWLQVSIVLYLLALGLSLFVSRPNVKRIIALSDEGAGGPPPPEMLKAITTVQRVGMILTVLLVAIVFLMVMKPDFGF